MGNAPMTAVLRHIRRLATRPGDEQPSDRQLLEFLEAARRPHAIVATKCDRLSGNELPRALRTLGQEYSGATIIPFKTGTA